MLYRLQILPETKPGANIIGGLSRESEGQLQANSDEWIKVPAYTGDREKQNDCLVICCLMREMDIY